MTEEGNEGLSVKHKFLLAVYINKSRRVTRVLEPFYVFHMADTFIIDTL